MYNTIRGVFPNLSAATTTTHRAVANTQQSDAPMDNDVITVTQKVVSLRLTQMCFIFKSTLRHTEYFLPRNSAHWRIVEINFP